MPAPDDGRRRWEGEHWSRRRDIERQLHDGPALRHRGPDATPGATQGRSSGGGTGDLQRDIDDLQGQLHIVLQELRASRTRSTRRCCRRPVLAPPYGRSRARGRVQVRGRCRG